MSFFDFLKPKKDPLKEPRFRPTMIRMMAAQLATQCSNLCAVGRKPEARAIALKFLVDQFRQSASREFLNSPKVFSALADAAIKLGEPKAGKDLLDTIIQTHESTRAKKTKESVLDLTQLYIDAGRLAHQIRGMPDEEYRCFWFAAEEKPPANCPEPATSRQKAIAHMYACSIASVTIKTDETDETVWNERKKWHDTKRREFAPECEWDDPVATMAWLKKTD